MIFSRLAHRLASYGFKQRMSTAIQILVILIVIFLPMISIAAFVLTLAILNMSFGIRRFYVKILSFFFDYATRIKKDREISIDPEFPTPQIESSIHDNTLDEGVELSPDMSMNNDSKLDDDLNISRQSSLQSDIQFKLSKQQLINNPTEKLDFFFLFSQVISLIILDKVLKRLLMMKSPNDLHQQKKWSYGIY